MNIKKNHSCPSSQRQRGYRGIIEYFKIEYSIIQQINNHFGANYKFYFSLPEGGENYISFFWCKLQTSR